VWQLTTAHFKDTADQTMSSANNHSKDREEHPTAVAGDSQVYRKSRSRRRIETTFMRPNE